MPHSPRPRRGCRMTERRPHWDDELILAVSEHIDPGHADVRAVIATVEDWCVRAHLQAVYVKRMNDAEARVEYLEAKLAGFDTTY